MNESTQVIAERFIVVDDSSGKAGQSGKQMCKSRELWRLRGRRVQHLLLSQLLRIPRPRITFSR
jgi:hypothetical protein